MKKTLIVKNYSTENAWGQLMIDAIANHVRSHQPSVEIDVCGAADGQELPDLKQYDLLILTGGVFDLVNYCPNPWVDPLLDQIREFVNSKSGKKLLGICWGHQATHFAMGGKLEMTPEGPIVSCPFGVQSYSNWMSRLESKIFPSQQLEVIFSNKNLS